MASGDSYEDDEMRKSTEPPEGITAWKKAKAGHAGEMTKIFNRLDEVLKDYRFISEVTELSRRLKEQWSLYCFAYNELVNYLTDDKERARESDRFNDQTRAYERYSFLIEQFLTRADLRNGEIEGGALSSQPTEAAISEHRPEDVRSSVSSGSRKSKGSSRSSRSKSLESAAVESVLAEARLEQLKKAKERKLKQQQLELENEIADAEDAAELARIKTRFYEQLDADKGSEGSVDTPVIEDPLLEPVTLEKVALPPGQPVRGNFEPFISGSSFQPPEKIPRSTLNPDARPFSQPKSERAGSFIPGLSLQQSQPPAFAPDPTLPETIPRPMLNPNAHSSSQPGSAFVKSAACTDSVLESVVTNMNLIATGASLPPLEVVKFCGDPCEFFKFKSRFYQMVESQSRRCPDCCSFWREKRKGL